MVKVVSEPYTDEIVALEFALFDKVNNEGGRAACQDDFRTFEIMRGAQFDAWTQEMRASYLKDLEYTQAEGRNLVMEKYAYMSGYDYLGELEGIGLKRELIAQIMAYMEPDTVKVHESHPNVARRSRPIGANVGGAVSVDNYLLCELMTYSINTLDLMCDYIEDLRAHGASLPAMTLENIAKRYGFEGLDDMEARVG